LLLHFAKLSSSQTDKRLSQTKDNPLQEGSEVQQTPNPKDQGIEPQLT